MNRDKREIISSLKYRVKDEGLAYALLDYSDWTELDDPIFHMLRTNYINSGKILNEYIHSLNTKHSIEYTLNEIENIKMIEFARKHREICPVKSDHFWDTIFFPIKFGNGSIA